VTAPAPDDVPLLDDDLLAQLAADLTVFTVDAAREAMGAMAAAALDRGDPVPARRALRETVDPAGVLTRLWLLGEPVSRRALDRALPTTTTEGLERLGLVRTSGHASDDGVLAAVDLRPIESDGATWWLASDVGEVVRGGPLRPDHVLGLGGASTTLARWTPREPVGRALDVGTGSGVQALYLARHASDVTGTDVSGRALAFARFNAALNSHADGPFRGRSLRLRQGNLLEPVAVERFDLVVSNPPFVITPRGPGAGQLPRYSYRDGGLVGDGVVAALVRGLDQVLSPGGVAQLLGNWEHRAGQGWRDRVSSWLPDGLDAWVVQREVQDAAEYAQTWARDAGHRPGTPAHDGLVERYLDDFEARGVDAVGLGVLTLRRPAVGEHPRAPLRRLEEISGPLGGGGPMGATVSEVLSAERWLAGVDDETLLDARLVTAADVTEERFGVPGAPDPQVVLLRQGGGLQRAVRVDTALAGLVGACDGELGVGQILAALTVLLDEPVGELTSRLLPLVRHLVADGLLRR
jgi:methylase of polypeptide subunit release factors